MINKITLHAGHNKQGKIACGASDYLDESKECRWLRKKITPILKKSGIQVKNATINDGRNQQDVLNRIVYICNSEKNVDLNAALHMNACAHENKANGKTKGVEVHIKPVANDDAQYTKTKTTMKYKVATYICKNLEKIGFTNRGVKFNDHLYFLNHTNKPAILVEVCFVDDLDDANLYKNNKEKIAKAIADAIIKWNKVSK